MRMAAGFRDGDQIRLVQHRQHRPAGRPDRVAILGLDHLGQHVDVHVGMRWRGRQGEVLPGPRQCVRDGAAADAAASRNGHPQRGGDPVGDRGAARVANLDRKPLQLVDENRMLPIRSCFACSCCYRPIVAEQLPIAA